MLIQILLIIVALILLIKGSDFFVKAAARIAQSLGVSEFFIGLTLVALGTSLPEFVSSIFASLDHETGIIIGTVSGANIANISLIIGVGAIIATIHTKREMIKRDGFFMLFTFLLILVFSRDGLLSRLEGGFLILLFISYLIFLFDNSADDKQHMGFGSFSIYFLKFGYVFSVFSKLMPKPTSHSKAAKLRAEKNAIFLDLGLMALCGTTIVLGAHFLVDNAVYLAQEWGVPQAMIGIFIAIGTTMPEMSVALSAAKKKMGNIVIGNAIGSTLTNSLLILGTASLISPLEISVFSQWLIIPFMTVLGITLLLYLWTKWQITKSEGIMLLSLYLVFLIVLTFTATFP